MKKIVSILFIFILCLQLTACDFLNSLQSRIFENTTQSQTTATRTTSFIAETNFKPINPSAYIIFNKLTASQQKIYGFIEEAVYNMKDSVDIGECSEADISASYYAVENDYPQYFWMSNGYMYRVVGDNYKVYFRKTNGKTSYDYNILKAQKNEMQTALNKRIEKGLSKISKGMSEYERELALHDFLVASVKYDTAAAADTGDTYNLSYTAYGALVQGKAVCEGFSRAFQLLLYYAGIENSLVLGASKDIGHMWNIVKINGEWVHTDTTFDNSDNSVYHTYFNVSDKYIKSDHTISSENVSLPACTTMKYNFGVVNKTYIASESDFNTVILKALKRNIPLGLHSIEFNFGEDYNRTFPANISAFIKDAIEPIVMTYNKGRIKSERINEILIAGGKGSKGFIFKKQS